MLIGIDIGGTKCEVARADDNGVLQDSRRFPTTAPADTQARIMEAVQQLSPDDAPIFGVSCGGPMDAQRGIILSPPNLPGWDQVPICAMLTQRFGGRARLMNDANAGALAGWKFGAGRGTRNMVFLTHGTGMGAGLILNGQLYEGTTGDAGEVGHVRMAPDGPLGYNKHGSFEGFCSGAGLARLAKGRIPQMPSPTAQQLAEAAMNGNCHARKIFEESGRQLGRFLALLVDIHNPEAIVLGSIYVKSGNLLEQAMREELAREALPAPLAACRILPAQLGEKTGIIAAIAVAQTLVVVKK